MMNDDFKIGDRVQLQLPGSGADGVVGTVAELNVSRSGDNGHMIAIKHGVYGSIIVKWWELRHVKG